MRWRAVGLIVVLALFWVGGAGAVKNVEEEAALMEGAFWRVQALDDLIPHWYEHVRDEEHGAFYMSLSRDWQPRPSWDKVPAMISREVFSFSAAYLLSGEEKYLQAAREGVDYLLEHAWDEEYGGWFDKLSQTGTPKSTTKYVALQLYTNVGLALYYFTTGDEQVLTYIQKSIEIRQTYAHDEEFGGYYEVLNRNLSVSNSGKNKHAHFGYVGSLLLNLFLATQDTDILQWEKHLTDLTLERMLDEEGWVHGFQSKFDRQWRLTPKVVDGREVVSIGAQLTAALSFLRLYHQTGDSIYLEHGKVLGDKISRYGWDAERGGWLDLVEKVSPYRPVATPTVWWWIHVYGSFLQLQLYHVTQDVQYLERFKKSEMFFTRYFIDEAYGGVFASVSPEGVLVGDGHKASVWNTSYHEIEHALLNYLYLNLYVNKKPAVLHFNLDGDQGAKHYVSLVDDPGVEIGGVTINGEPWAQFNAQERYVVLPAGKGLKVEVILSPGRTTNIAIKQDAVPLSNHLHQNHPNPFNSSTTIYYTVPELMEVNLTIYNILGRKVRTLVEGKRPPAAYTIRWDGLNDVGMQAGSGVYLYRLKTAGFTQTNKMLLMK